MIQVKEWEILCGFHPIFIRNYGFLFWKLELNEINTILWAHIFFYMFIFLSHAQLPSLIVLTTLKFCFECLFRNTNTQIVISILWKQITFSWMYFQRFLAKMILNIQHLTVNLIALRERCFIKASLKWKFSKSIFFRWFARIGIKIYFIQHHNKLLH